MIGAQLVVQTIGWQRASLLAQQAVGQLCKRLLLQLITHPSYQLLVGGSGLPGQCQQTFKVGVELCLDIALFGVAMLPFFAHPLLQIIRIQALWLAEHEVGAQMTNQLLTVGVGAAQARLQLPGHQRQQVIA